MKLILIMFTTCPHVIPAIALNMERSSNVSHFQCILRHRQLTVDPTIHLSTFKKKIYSPGSSVRRLKLEKQLHSHEGCVNCISFSHDGHLLVSGSDDLQIVLWDWSKGKIVGKFDSKHVANVFQVNSLHFMILFRVLILEYCTSMGI